MQSFLRRALNSHTHSSSQASIPRRSSGSDFIVAPDEKSLFPVTDPAVDGEDCDRDCESCTIHYPAKFSINEGDKLYGHVKGWSTHLLVATGKTDWVRSVEDEKGSVMEAVGRAHKPSNGKLMLSASNMPLPDNYHDFPPGKQPTQVLLLPSFTLIDNIAPADVPKLIDTVISHAPTNTTRSLTDSEATSHTTELATALDSAKPPRTTESITGTDPSSLPTNTHPLSIPFPSQPCPHIAIILLCSQKTRDARCGQSAPLLRREFERHLRPLGLYRDLHDTRPGGVGIYFISHVGGHKYSANCMIYRRGGDAFRKWNPKPNGAATVANGKPIENGVDTTAEALKKLSVNGTTTPPPPSSTMAVNGVSSQFVSDEALPTDDGAAQCIWLARVRPEDCEGIINFTVLKGKVIKPQSQLRGGFDREKGLVSW